MKKYKVIGIYPGSHLSIGAIVDEDYGRATFDAPKDFDKYPAIYEEIKEELPVYGRKINPLDLFLLDVKSNQFIKKYRDDLGLETPNNRIDTGDLKMIIIALHEMGFDCVERLPVKAIKPEFPKDRIT